VQTGAGAGAESGPGSGNVGRRAKQQAGSIDPGMEASKRRSRCRRAKGRCERDDPDRAAASGEPGSVDPGAGKPVTGERNGNNVQRARLRCSVPCIPAVLVRTGSSGIAHGSRGFAEMFSGNTVPRCVAGFCMCGITKPFFPSNVAKQVSRVWRGMSCLSVSAECAVSCYYGNSASRPRDCDVRLAR
jgi:hypothetical protein